MVLDILVTCAVGTRACGIRRNGAHKAPMTQSRAALAACAYERQGQRRISRSQGERAVQLAEPGRRCQNREKM